MCLPLSRPRPPASNDRGAYRNPLTGPLSALSLGGKRQEPRAAASRLRLGERDFQDGSGPPGDDPLHGPACGCSSGVFFEHNLRRLNAFRRDPEQDSTMPGRTAYFVYLPFIVSKSLRRVSISSRGQTIALDGSFLAAISRTPCSYFIQASLNARASPSS